MKYFIYFLCFSLCGCSAESINRTLEAANESMKGTQAGLSQTEVIAGLKEALEVGTGEAISLSSVTDGFYKNPELYIPFPEEAEMIKETALSLGLKTQVDQFEKTLNRAAEEAVKDAGSIFVNAIKEMTIQDGFEILNGGDSAATHYLKSKTHDILLSRFQPKVDKAIKQVKLTEYYSPLANAYNAATLLSGGDQIDPDLSSYVTARAIDGLFLLIAREEAEIRENPAARITEILEKVFGTLDNK